MQQDPSKDNNKRLLNLSFGDHQHFTGAFMLGILGLLIIDARKISDYVREHVELNVFLQDGIPDTEVNAYQSNCNPILCVLHTLCFEGRSTGQFKKGIGEGG